MRSEDTLIGGRNPAVEALRSGVPVRRVLLADGIDSDRRVQEIRERCEHDGIEVRLVARRELDRLTGTGHQGVVVVVPPFTYADEREIVDRAFERAPHLLLAVDGVTDPRNLGAIVRSAAAFGASGVLLPKRRAAGVTPAVWKASAGALARMPLARVTNMARVLVTLAERNVTVVGLSADGETTIQQAADDAGGGPVALVVGAEGRGLSRLVREKCTIVASIPMTGTVESLNVSVATGIALFVLSQRLSG